MNESIAFYKTMKKLNLADRKAWTISDSEKRPIDPTQGLKCHFREEDYDPQAYYKLNDHTKWGNLAKNPEEVLVTLTDLFKEPNTPLHAFALEADIERQKLLLIDLEKEYNPDIKPYLKLLPYIYGERSRHGGLHFIVPVSDEILRIPKYRKLFQDPNKKVGTTKNKHSGLEIFFHNHYLTFTENQVPIKNNNTQEDLKKFLDWLIKKVSIANNNKENYISTDPNHPHSNKLQIPYDALNMAEHALSYGQIDFLDEYCKKINDPNYIGDEDHPMEDTSRSHRDYLIVFALARAVLTSMSHEYRGVRKPLMKDNFNFMTDKNAGYQPDIIVWMVIQLAIGEPYHYLPDRPKLRRIISSQHQTYLQYIANRAVNYLLEHNHDEYAEVMKAHPSLKPKEVQIDNATTPLEFHHDG